jgi:UDP-3-O-acyl-N-acetylglucosamine deacetylase
MSPRRSRGVPDRVLQTEPLQHNLLDLIEGDLVVAAVVELGGARAFVRGHLLGMLEQAAVLQIDRDAGRAERVAAELGGDAGRRGAAPDQW